MNKKLIIGILILILIIIVGLIYYNDINNADTEVPYINNHLQKANNEYNIAVDYLNTKNFSQSSYHCNESYVEYVKTKTHTQTALNKAIKNNQSLQIDYFTYTIDELELKINATVELYNGLTCVNSNPRTALSYFDRSNQLMKEAKDYTDKRSLLEQQYPDKFI